MMLGKVIRKYRKERNFTQEEMAERLGVTASAVNKWERGSLALISPYLHLLPDCWRFPQIPFCLIEKI